MPSCENCLIDHQHRDGLCLTCFVDCLERSRAEKDPNLERWEELRARDMTSSEKAEQIELGKEFQWLI